jgi:multicomponent K+:H+ antiporter subunit A
VLGDETPYYSLAIWHGFTLPLLMSVTALAGGALLYAIFRQRFATAKVSPLTGWIVGRKAFEATLGAIILGARWLAAILRTTHLQPQMRLLIGAGLVAGALPFLALGYRAGLMPLTPVEPMFAAIWLLGGAAAIGAAWQAKFHRLAAFVLMGIAGLATCVTFVFLSAPDLALTQLLVEFATGVLFLRLRWLPKRLPDIYPEGRPPFRVRLRRSADLALAIAAGIGISAMSFAIMTRPPQEGISRFFLENAYREAGGTNVVNVMLVDFRAFDTMGEITVLCIVGLTVFSLLRRFRPAREVLSAPEQQRLQKAFDAAAGLRKVGHALNYLYVPGAIMQWLFPVIITFAVYLFLRGHDLPGGGFAAGVTLSIAIIVQYMAMGTKRTEALLRVRPLTWAGLGLLCSASTGAAAMLFGYPFLTSWFSYVHVPLIGEVPAASALIFDLGVFTLVVGATVLVLIPLAHQSIRAPHAKPAPRGNETR